MRATPLPAPWWWALTGIAFGAVVLAAACGGGGSDEATPPTGAPTSASTVAPTLPSTSTTLASTTLASTTLAPTTRLTSTTTPRLVVAEVGAGEHTYAGRIYGWGADVTDIAPATSGGVAVKVQNLALANTGYGGRGTYRIEVTATSASGEQRRWRLTPELQYQEEREFEVPARSLFGAPGTYTLTATAFLAGGEQSGWRSAQVNVTTA